MRRLPAAAHVVALCLLLPGAACDAPGTEQPVALPPGATFVEVEDAFPSTGPASRGSSGGFALADLNADGALDLIATTGYGIANTVGDSPPIEGGTQALLLGAGDGTFAEGGPLPGPENAVSLATADFDGDGDLDVILPTAGPRDDVFTGGPTYVYENTGGALTPHSTLPTLRGIPYSACPGDFDGDGDLDLFITQLYAPDHLLRNDGNLSFTDVTVDSGSIGDYDTWTNACLAMDIDDDGDLDLFAAYETLPIGIVLHENDGAMNFVNASERVLGSTANRMGNWMGFAAGDHDGDGDVDVFVTNMGFGAFTIGGTSVTTVENGTPLHALLENQGDGTFRDIAPTVEVKDLAPLPEPILAYPDEASGLAALEFGWTAWFLDYDNDADEDLLFFGSWAFSSRFQIVGTRERGANPGRLLENDGRGSYREVARAAGIENLERDGSIANGWGSAVADLNDDGFLDVVLANQSFGEEDAGFRSDIRVWLNEGNDNGAIEVDLVGRASAPHGFGARVVVELGQDGELTRVTQQRVSASAISAAPVTPLHFGVPAGATVERVTVSWPSGATSEALPPFERRVVIEETP